MQAEISGYDGFILPYKDKIYILYYHTQSGYEIDFVTQDVEGKYELIQIVWETHDPETLNRETRALRQAEKELGFPGRLLDYTQYLQRFGLSP